MKNTMEYKGYIGSVEFSEEDCILYGKVMGIRSLISYEGETAKELLEDFHGAVDDYLTLCKENGIVPETAYKGSFHEMSLNSYVEETLKNSPAAKI